MWMVLTRLALATGRTATGPLHPSPTGGYKDTPELKKLLDFFVAANEKTFEKLIAYVEE